MWHKRYAYAVAMDLNGGVIGSGDNDNEYVDFSFADGDLQLDDIMNVKFETCLLYTSPSPRDQRGSRMPSSA